MSTAEKPLTLRVEKKSRAGYVFVVCVFVLFLQAGFYTAHRSHTLEHETNPEQKKSSKWLSQSHSLPFADTTESTVIVDHPIPKLMLDAETKFRKLLTKQSTTLKAAVSEYKTRYGRSPPKGFDVWWKFAKENNVRLVDEFDGVIDDLKPFWELSPQELRRRALEAALLADVDLVRIKNGTATPMNIKEGQSEKQYGGRAAGLALVMENFSTHLPDMDFAINARSEGRVLVPWEHRKYPNMTVQDSSAGLEAMLGGPFVPDWKDDGNVWEAYRRTCDPSSPARRLYASLRNSLTHHVVNYFSKFSSGSSFSSKSTSYPSLFSSQQPISSHPHPSHSLRFVETIGSSLDLCQNPHTHYTQGNFFSDWRTVPVMLPIFSPAKIKGFLDIRLPSHYYYGSTPRYTYGWDAINLEGKEVDGMEVAWENKTEKVFWRGATIGGGSHPPGFVESYHRHRFVRMASTTSNSSSANSPPGGANITISFASPPSSTRFVPASVPLGTLNEEIMDVAFVKPMGEFHYPGGLEGMKRDHRFGDGVSLGGHYEHKYLLDLDGNAYSGRFMAFLASDSAVVKASIYQEYFEGWIQPWLHYIPLSSTYRDIYNIHAYFSGATPLMLKYANVTTHSDKEKLRPIEGDRRLRRIARAGKQWKKTIGRKVDMEAYVFRLALEYARLCTDDRDSMNYD